MRATDSLTDEVGHNGANSIAKMNATLQPQQNGLEILKASFTKGDTGSAVQLLKRGVDTPEIRLAALQHKNGEPLRRALEEYQMAPTIRQIKYNPPGICFPDGKRIIAVDQCAREGAPDWARLNNTLPGFSGYYVCEEVVGNSRRFVEASEFLAALKVVGVAGKKWIAALTKATDPQTANFVVNGHYVHATTRNLLLQLALLGYRPRLVSSGSGKYIRLSETYGEYRYQDVVELDARVNLSGSEPYRPAEVAALFGSSGSKNTWTVRADGHTVDVTCWH